MRLERLGADLPAGGNADPPPRQADERPSERTHARGARPGTKRAVSAPVEDTGTGGGQARAGFAGAPRPSPAARSGLWNHADPLRTPRSRGVHEPNCGQRKRLRSLDRGDCIQRAGSRSTRARMARFFEPEPKLGAGRLRAHRRGLQLCATKRSHSQKRRAAGQDPRDLAAWATTSRSADHLAGPPSLIESGAHEAGALARIIHGVGSATPIEGGFLRLRKGFPTTDTECPAPQIRLVLALPARISLARWSFTRSLAPSACQQYGCGCSLRAASVRRDRPHQTWRPLA